MTTSNPIKFNLHNIVNTATGAKCKVRYSAGQVFDPADRGVHHSKRRLVDCVTIYAKDCLEKLAPVVGDTFLVQNDSDSMTDYCESDRVRVYADHPLYAEVLAAAKRVEATRRARFINRRCPLAPGVTQAMVDAAGGPFPIEATEG